MELVLCLAIVLVGALGAAALIRTQATARRRTELGDARAEAQRWYERLGGQLMNLHGDEPAVRQALSDAGERYNAAGSQLEQARTPHQFGLARETALEGLAYIRAARTALGIDPGPEVPQLAAARGVGQLTKEREVDVQGQTFRAGPQPGRETPYYYPGGRYQGRPVPSGWYSTPWWKTALGAGAGVLGGMLIADALFSPAFADPGYQDGGAGAEQGADGGDQGGDQDFGGADQGGDAGGGDYAGGDYGGGDYAGGDFGGGGFGGGDFGGGDFGGGDW
ncbi:MULTISPECIES: hypothetical protein [unclassified Micromonospora]|uniref:hypothetical protein n=1 Tax=unclassified Micromonospora TaxID=2617518 RepID=UPI00368A82A2|nr:hypothetical protein OG990_24995 [Micromonospora sp. NBC_00858]